MSDTRSPEAQAEYDAVLDAMQQQPSAVMANVPEQPDGRQRFDPEPVNTLECIGAPVSRSSHAEMRIEAARMLVENRREVDMVAIRRLATFLIEGR